MVIQINVSRETAIAAMCYNLTLSEKITSRKKFIAILTNYVDQWGVSSQDDHVTEGEDYYEKAEKIVDKYFEIV